MNGSQIVVVALAIGLPLGVAAQVSTVPEDTATAVAESSRALGRARAAQGRFERSRVRHFPVTFDSFGGSCDETVGRFCSWYDEGDWVPEPEPDEVGVLRAELLATLDSIQTRLPGDGWVLGQRVWYLVEDGRPEQALTTASECMRVDLWWCEALQGFVLHTMNRYVESMEAFGRALLRMDADRAQLWRMPRRAMDSDGRSLLDDLRQQPRDSVNSVLRRLWMLADPLFLVDGNDRETEHYARWTVATLRERSRQPYRIAWGSDMEELTIRHGWEIGWERSPNGAFSALDNIVGHKHPQGRDFMPPGSALRDPRAATARGMRADRSRPRSLYAPAYAPVLLPMEGQLAVFPRANEIVVVATYDLPDDTTRSARHGHSVPWMEPGEQAGLSDRAGLFLLPIETGPRRSVTTLDRDAGALILKAPGGAFLVSAEVWSPRRRRAARARFGFERHTSEPDVAGLSDLLLLSPQSIELGELEAAVPMALLRSEVPRGRPLAIGWEVSGLGFRRETLEYEVSVERNDRGLIGRVGDFLGLTSRPRSLELSWEEPSPVEPGHAFRTINLEVPDLDAGEYRIDLVLRIAGRSDVRVQKVFRVTEAR